MAARRAHSVPEAQRVSAAEYGLRAGAPSTEEQRRDILYNNAARFLGLGEHTPGAR